jgi:hypothetical protein
MFKVHKPHLYLKIILIISPRYPASIKDGITAGYIGSIYGISTGYPL